MDNYEMKCKEEAEATIRKTKEGKYLNLLKTSLVAKGHKKLTRKQLNNILKKTRLRFSLTPKCNLWCIFCSNEGASYSDKKYNHADIDLVIKLSEMMLKASSVRAIDFSGGEPTIHPDFQGKKFKLLKWTKKHPEVRFAIHSNGIELKRSIIDGIKENFSRIGVSVNSFNFETWNKMTNLNKIFSPQIQKEKYTRLMENLNYLAEQSIGHKVFVKSVIMRGINDTEPEIEFFLQKCSEYGFHPKFFQFEPQYREQRKYVVGRDEFFTKLKRIGCKFETVTSEGNKEHVYIPSINFQYKDAPLGVHSFFGCGLKKACDSCYDIACSFIKPTKDGRGLYLKPCLVTDTKIDLTHATRTNDHQQLLSLFKMAREYLMLPPGIGTTGWGKESEFNFCHG